MKTVKVSGWVAKLTWDKTVGGVLFCTQSLQTGSQLGPNLVRHGFDRKTHMVSEHLARGQVCQTITMAGRCGTDDWFSPVMMVARRIKRQDRIALCVGTLDTLTRQGPLRYPFRRAGVDPWGQPLKGLQLGWLDWFDGHTRHLNANWGSMYSRANTTP